MMGVHRAYSVPLFWALRKRCRFATLNPQTLSPQFDDSFTTCTSFELPVSNCTSFELHQFRTCTSFAPVAQSHSVPRRRF